MGWAISGATAAAAAGLLDFFASIFATGFASIFATGFASIFATGFASIFATGFAWIFAVGFDTGRASARVLGSGRATARAAGFSAARIGLAGGFAGDLAGAATLLLTILRAGGAVLLATRAAGGATRFFTPSVLREGEPRLGDFSSLRSAFPPVRRALALLDLDSVSAPPPSRAGRFPGGLLVTTTVGRS
jgi:hypothetical protein